MASGTTIFRRPTGDFLSVGGSIDSARSQQSPIYEGLVVDVIVDHYIQNMPLMDIMWVP